MVEEKSFRAERWSRFQLKKEKVALKKVVLRQRAEDLAEFDAKLEKNMALALVDWGRLLGPELWAQKKAELLEAVAKRDSSRVNLLLIEYERIATGTPDKVLQAEITNIAAWLYSETFPWQKINSLIEAV